MPLQRPAQPRRLRAGDEHDLGRPRHPAPRAHAGAGAAEGARRVHSGDEPRGAFRRGPGAGGDAAQRAQAARPFALRAVPPLSRDLLPLGPGGQRHAVLAPRARPRLRGRAGGPGAPPRSGADAAARGRAHRRRARRPRAAAPGSVRSPGRAAGVRRGRRARRADAERAGPRGRPARLVAAGLRRLSRGGGRTAVPAPRAEAAEVEAAAARDAGNLQIVDDTAHLAFIKKKPKVAAALAAFTDQIPRRDPRHEGRHPGDRAVREGDRARGAARRARGLRRRRARRRELPCAPAARRGVAPVGAQRGHRVRHPAPPAARGAGPGRVHAVRGGDAGHPRRVRLRRRARRHRPRAGLVPGGGEPGWSSRFSTAPT